jgi:hypothetical protein
LKSGGPLGYRLPPRPVQPFRSPARLRLYCAANRATFATTTALSRNSERARPARTSLRPSGATRAIQSDLSCSGARRLPHPFGARALHPIVQGQGLPRDLARIVRGDGRLCCRGERRATISGTFWPRGPGQSERQARDKPHSRHHPYFLISSLRFMLRTSRWR